MTIIMLMMENKSWSQKIKGKTKMKHKTEIKHETEIKSKIGLVGQMPPSIMMNVMFL